MYKAGEVLDAGVGVVNERLIVTITTVDEVDEYDIGWAHSSHEDAVQIAYDLADRIGEYISETSFGWGEQRWMHGPMPGPSGVSDAAASLHSKRPLHAGGRSSYSASAGCIRARRRRRRSPVARRAVAKIAVRTKPT